MTAFVVQGGDVAMSQVQQVSTNGGAGSRAVLDSRSQGHSLSGNAHCRTGSGRGLLGVLGIVVVLGFSGAAYR
jgi:hypothetical protein